MRPIPQWLRWMMIVIITLGVGLRVGSFINSGSFWKDEVGLARNFLTRDLARISEPFGDGQTAPVGFVQVSKLSEMAWGHSEQTFWLWPTFISILMILVAAKVWRRQLPPVAWAMAVAAVAFSPALLSNTVQFKPYGCDAFWTLALTATFWAYRGSSRRSKGLVYLLVGLLSLWMSYSAVFVIAGLGLYSIVEDIRKKRPQHLVHGIVINGLLAVVFGVLYWTNYRLIDPNGFFKSAWEGNFAPLNELGWYCKKLPTLSDYLLGPWMGWMGLLIMGLGIAKARGMNPRLMVLLAPLALTLLASWAGAYPIHGRLVLFWVPLVIPFFALGIYSVWEHFQAHKGIVALLALTVGMPYVWPAAGALEGNNTQQLRPIAESVAQKAKAGDVVWVHPRATELYKYYFKRYPLADGVVVTNGTNDEVLGILDVFKQQYPGKTVYVVGSEPNLTFTEMGYFVGLCGKESIIQNDIILASAFVYECKIPPASLPSGPRK